MRAQFCRYILNFKKPAKTSREVLTNKETYFIKIWDERFPDVYGIGECALFRGLSADDVPNYENTLRKLCPDIEQGFEISILNYSSIRFGVETAINDLKNGGKRIVYSTPWSQGESEIPINGLIWMGDKDIMSSQIKEKLDKGFRCLKLKIGGIDFNEELELLEYIRKQFSADILELRLDANGAFFPNNALDRLNQLSKYEIHSIEQPIKPRQWDALAHLCETSPIPIALDEELIGINTSEEQIAMLDAVCPQYIILKPALCGGFSGAEQWIAHAQQRNIGWWATSALESNIGLNAIAQWVASKNTSMLQGLGTGALYTNNITAPITLERDIIKYNPQLKWEIPELDWQN